MHFAFACDRDLQPAEPGRNRLPSRSRQPRASSDARARRRHSIDRHDRRLVRLPVRRRRRPRPDLGARWQVAGRSAGRDRPRGHDRRRHSEPGADSSSAAAVRSGTTDRRAPAQHTQHRATRTPIAALEAGREHARRLGRRDRRLPLRPRATGNIATEDLVYLLHGEGIETGVDLDALIGVAEWLEDVLGRPLEGQVYRAGTFASVAG